MQVNKLLKASALVYRTFKFQAQANLNDKWGSSYLRYKASNSVSPLDRISSRCHTPLALLTRQYATSVQPYTVQPFLNGRLGSWADFGVGTLHAAKLYCRDPLSLVNSFRPFQFPGGLRFFQFHTLGAIHVKASQLPMTFALFIFEVIRSSPLVKAESASTVFGMYPDASVLSAAAKQRADANFLAALWRRLQTVAAELWYNFTQILHAMWLVTIFTPVLLTAPIAFVLDFRQNEWMDWFRRTLEVAGPAFIKWGQWAATRHDVFPPNFCAELERLHSQAPAHHYRHTRRAVEAAFGLPLHELFTDLDTKPVASGSIGQVHRATLSARGAAMTGYAPGTVVAVKVRHPGVGDSILRDFGLMVWVASLAGHLSFLRPLRLEETLRQFAAPLREQVDLAREGGHLLRFNQNFRKASHVHFPVPLYPLVHTDVLVESFEEGCHITEYLASPGNPHNVRLSELGSGTMLQMMLVDNLIHSDLHPGNILVRLDPPRGLLGFLCRGLEKARDACAPSDPAARAMPTPRPVPSANKDNSNSNSSNYLSVSSALPSEASPLASPPPASGSGGGSGGGTFSAGAEELDGAWLSAALGAVRARVLTPSLSARLDLLLQRWRQPSLVLLDVGMTTELSPQDQVNMVGLFRSFAAMDGRACGEWTLRFSGEEQSCPDPEAFISAMEETFEALRRGDRVSPQTGYVRPAESKAVAAQHAASGICVNERTDNDRFGIESNSCDSFFGGGGIGRGALFGDETAESVEIDAGAPAAATEAAGGPIFSNSAEALGSVLEHVRTHQVCLPGHICAVVVTTLVLEGWSNKLDPEHSILTQVQSMFEPVNLPWAHRVQRIAHRAAAEGLAGLVYA